VTCTMQTCSSSSTPLTTRSQLSSLTCQKFYYHKKKKLQFVYQSPSRNFVTIKTKKKYILSLKNAYPHQHTHLPVHLARIQLPEILTCKNVFSYREREGERERGREGEGERERGREREREREREKISRVSALTVFCTRIKDTRIKAMALTFQRNKKNG
jgi:hypothetical protein